MLRGLPKIMDSCVRRYVLRDQDIDQEIRARSLADLLRISGDENRPLDLPKVHHKAQKEALGRLFEYLGKKRTAPRKTEVLKAALAVLPTMGDIEPWVVLHMVCDLLYASRTNRSNTTKIITAALKTLPQIVEKDPFVAYHMVSNLINASKEKPADRATIITVVLNILPKMVEKSPRTALNTVYDLLDVSKSNSADIYRINIAALQAVPDMINRAGGNNHVIGGAFDIVCNVFKGKQLEPPKKEQGFLCLEFGFAVTPSAPETKWPTWYTPRPDTEKSIDIGGFNGDERALRAAVAKTFPAPDSPSRKHYDAVLAEIGILQQAFARSITPEQAVEEIRKATGREYLVVPGFSGAQPADAPS